MKMVLDYRVEKERENRCGKLFTMLVEQERKEPEGVPRKKHKQLRHTMHNVVQRIVCSIILHTVRIHVVAGVLCH